MSQPPVAPFHLGERFSCPRCGAFSHQVWGHLRISVKTSNGQRGFFDTHSDFSDVEEAFCVRGTNTHVGFGDHESVWMYSLCTSCEGSTVWRGEQIVHPAALTAPTAHTSMPASARSLYDEARATLPVSRRAAAALARAALEALLRELEPANKSKRLDEMLASMQGRLGNELWQILTALRVVGNNVLHGDTDDLVVLLLDADDDVVIEPLFSAINTIVEKEIAQPARTRAIYDLIPETKRQSAEDKASRAARDRPAEER